MGATWVQPMQTSLFAGATRGGAFVFSGGCGCTWRGRAEASLLQ